MSPPGHPRRHPHRHLHRHLHRDALAVLEAWQAPSPAQEQLRRDYLAHLEAHPDGTDRGCFPAHLTASTLILSADRERVLLTLHAKARAWFQTGGHCEPDDATLSAAALREAVEESGIAELTLDEVPVHLDAHEVGFCHPSGPVDHLDVRFRARAAAGASGPAGPVSPASPASPVSTESLDVAWWPVDALPSDEPGLHELVRLALAD